MMDPLPSPSRRTSPRSRLRLLATFILLMLLVSGLLAWAPWITPAAAGERAAASFSSAWQGVADGCGFNCAGCGVTGAWKAPFGVRVEVEYACGMLPADSPEYHRRAVAFVSFLGSVHGLPAP